jgi:hypothetical protein
MDVYTIGSDVGSDVDGHHPLSSGSSEEALKLDTVMFIRRVEEKLAYLDLMLVSLNQDSGAPGGCFVEDQVLLILEVRIWGWRGRCSVFVFVFVVSLAQRILAHICLNRSCETRLHTATMS